MNRTNRTKSTKGVTLASFTALATVDLNTAPVETVDTTQVDTNTAPVAFIVDGDTVEPVDGDTAPVDGDTVALAPLQTIVDVSPVDGSTVLVTDVEPVDGDTAPVQVEPVRNMSRDLFASTALAPVDTAPVSVDALRASIVLAVNTAIHGRTDHWSQHRETRAGIPIPRGNGLCATAWYMFDYNFARGIVDTASNVEYGFTVLGLNRGNLRTEISRYRKYHGIARIDVGAVSVAPVTVQVDTETK
jgi:hypothetical protein